MSVSKVTGIQIKSCKNTGLRITGTHIGSDTYEVKYTVTYADGTEMDSSAWYVNCTDEMEAVAAVYKKENYHGV